MKKLLKGLKKKMSYDNFSGFYDSLTLDVNYKKRTEYILSVFEKYDKKPTLLLDLACGTGSFSVEFAKNKISVIGVDKSVGMLNKAREKVQNSGLDVLLLNQSAEQLDLYGTVDGAVCCLDSINHITNYKKIEKAFKKVSLFLEKDRLFVFDVNTLFKHKKILSGKTYTLEEKNVFCVWQNSECSKNGVVDISLDFFSKQPNGTYTRYSEAFSERAYSNEELTVALNKAGFEVLDILADMKFENSKKDEQRVFFVARKVK